ncbi:putative feruloyl esterase B-2 [Cytospora mali]|uniref:Carboxylic ester hydrolase n=1 Tax=Cytospora mali TaxID=578113 RepID=A0A194V7D4_CYTMA|nr:putative feruloyl esterase B-2 [Valsa mali var. pyri (nom. inval.)]
MFSQSYFSFISTRLALATSLAALAVSGQNTTDFDTKCTSFASSLVGTIPNATIWFTEPVAAGTNVSLPDNDPTCDLTSQIVEVDMCRVSMFVATSDRSNISMEVWLPTTEAWTGRFLSTGNGGLGGCIQYYDLAYAVDLGFSAVATNNGHNGTRGFAFYDNDEVVEDFAYRAMHTGVVLGKEVSEAFYGREHDKSYYLGCSTGGRQGFKEAQDFPDDFDGLVIGAPAVAYTNLTSWSGSFYLATGDQNSSTFIPESMWPVIHQNILDQCDYLDGYVDGIIEDPTLCDYRPEALICEAGNTTDCLTGVQANTVRQIFSPLYGQDGHLVYPAMQPGSELIASSLYYTGSPFIYTTDWFRYAIYNNPDWDPATLGPKDYSYAAEKNPFNIMTWEGDLSAVRDRGSKILHYHGEADYIISSFNSPRYYNHVSQTMGLTSSSLDEFYRFFRISGMGHCYGGNGATFIGQRLSSNATLDPDGNVLMAMVRWVEEGQAPDSILGTAYVNETKSSGEIAFQRRHCKYPARNVYSGSGDPTTPDSWECI